MGIQMKMKDFKAGRVRLLSGPLKKRFDLNKQYIMSLTHENLLRNFYLESGLWSYSGNGGTTSATTTSLDGPEQWHWGWESPTCELRGHIMGHWLSAAAHVYVQTDDPLVKAKADYIVSELARCQEANGGEWLAAFPETYMYRIAKGKFVWAPHYTIHKLLMGLYEMYVIAGKELALRVMSGIA
ncbi:beta-L-arabinofuranosidase domain-containing protein, partial [Paenibacillus odorifer]|uniref:beta-L-arabinofuranosidase domain-containing protein n=1 Tax=Paenibacillus odorifer TaxID=189426 RepID=UPI0028991E2D